MAETGAENSESAEGADESAEERELTPEEQAEQARLAELEAGRMPFFEHLRELRLRLRNVVIALIGGFGIAYAFHKELFALLLLPYHNVRMELVKENPAVGEESALVFTSMVEGFWTYFSLSFWAGLFLASPFVFYQLWKFISPGLYKGERRIGVWFAVFSALLFIGGACFCYFFVLEPVFRFLLDYSTSNLSEMNTVGLNYDVGAPIRITPMLTMQGYLDFAKKILIGFGFAFELPLVIFFLAMLGIVDHRKLWKFNRWAVIIAFVIAAGLTPPDVVSQSFLAGPIVVLYNISIIIAFFVTRARERKEKALYGDDPPLDDPDDEDDDESTS